MALRKELLQKSLPSGLPPRGFLQPRRYAVRSACTHTLVQLVKRHIPVRLARAKCTRDAVTYRTWVLQLELLILQFLVVIMFEQCSIM